MEDSSLRDCEEAYKRTKFTQNLKMFQTHESFYQSIESSILTVIMAVANLKVSQGVCGKCR